MATSSGSLQKKQYKLRPEVPAEHKIELAAHSERMAKLLYHRGITTAEQAARFLKPDYNRDLQDPFLLKDMDKAVNRILKAVAEKEKIVIYGDYDADGVPATVVMHDFFAKIGHTNIDFYIPHRHTEGFGLNHDAVDIIKAKGATLMITVDCGIADVEEVNRAQSLGIDVIVTDHHEPPEVLPEAFAIIDPKQPGCEYPEKMLCGSGVAYKVVQAILSHNRFGIVEGWEKWLLDMVGIATLSDMVPLVGENRAFASYGLYVARKSPRVGLVRLLKATGVSQRVLSEDDVGFSISPRINAASRMGDPIEAFKLLVATDEVEAAERAKLLERLNTERKTIVAQITKEAKKVIQERFGENVPAVLAIGNPSWMPSLLGLVCTSLSREFNRPTFMWGREGGEELKGSCRSDGVCDVVAVMRAVPSAVLVQCGGHAQAGGFVVHDKGVHHFEEAMLAAHASLQIIPSEQDQENDDGVIWIDDEVSVGDVTERYIKEVSSLAPFGMGNPKPLLMVKGATVVSISAFGSAKQHLEVVVEDSFTGKQLSLFSFYATPVSYAKPIVVGQVINPIGYADVSVFRGRTRIRMRIEDVI